MHEKGGIPMNLRSIYKKYKRKKQLQTFAPYFSISPDTVLCDNFNLDLRAPQSGTTYLTIGDGGVIDSSFVFETETGTITVGDRVHIGGGTQLISRNQISIGNDVIIAWNCTIYDHNSHSTHSAGRSMDVTREHTNLKEGRPVLFDKDWSVVRDAPIIIGDKAWIGFGVTILKGVTIGEGAVIGAGSVVTHDIPPYTVAAGNPATVIRKTD